MTTPRMLSGSSPEDDPTGVRALLSSLPDPGPMPTYVVERISASLAAEQAHRTPADPLVVTPLSAARRRRRSAPRIVLALAGAAAAVVVIGIVGNNLLNTRSGTSDAAATALSAGSSEAGSGGATSGGDYDRGKTAAAAATPQLQIRLSTTDYREARFVEQAEALAAPLRGALSATPPARSQPSPGHAPSAPSSGAPAGGAFGPLATPAGLRDCLEGIGLTSADLVVADLATYNGQPAAVIVATSAGVRTAYVVGRDCNHAAPSLLHAAVSLH